AADSASRSRRAVATETSSSVASSAAVTRPRACISSRAATSRSARIPESLRKSCQLMSTLVERLVLSAQTRGDPSMLRGLTTISYFADDPAAAARWYAELTGKEPYFIRPVDGPPAYIEFRLGDYQHEL